MNKVFFKKNSAAFFIVIFLFWTVPCAAASIDDVLQTLSSDRVNNGQAVNAAAGNSSASSSSGAASQTSSTLRGIITPGLSDANVRSSAWGDITGKILPGVLIEIKGEEGDWYIIEFEGKKGYVLKQALVTSNNLTSSSRASSAISGTVNICKNYMLNVRAAAYGDKIGTLNAYDKVQIIGEEGDWYKINFNGRLAYVHKYFIQPSASAQSANAISENTATTNISTVSTGAATTTATTSAASTTSTATQPATVSTTAPPAASSGNQLIDWLKQAGFKGDGLRVAWAIAMRESNGIPNIGKGTKYFNGYDWGLFQLNKPTFGKKSWWDDQKIQDPIYCSKVVYDLSKGGTYWIPWGLSGDGKSMNAACYKMWSAEKQRKCIWEPFKKWYDKYPLK